MGAKNQALKNAARLRMKSTGQTYEAALRDVRSEYERGEAPGSTETGAFSGSGAGATADPHTHRPRVGATGYLFAWAYTALFPSKGVEQQFMDQAESTTEPGADPLLCSLCDGRIDPEREREVHVSLALREVQPPGPKASVKELQMPVWTHAECTDLPKTWSWSELTEVRHRRGLPVDQADRPPRVRKRGTADFALFSVTPSGGVPLVYLQPGDPHTFGDLGFRADMLSAGLPPLDLTRDQPQDLDPWTLTTEGGRVTALRRGTAEWYRDRDGWTATTQWWEAARTHEHVIVLTAPHGTLTQDAMRSAQPLAGLGPVGGRGRLFGGIMAISAGG